MNGLLATLDDEASGTRIRAGADDDVIDPDVQTMIAAVNPALNVDERTAIVTALGAAITDANRDDLLA